MEEELTKAMETIKEEDIAQDFQPFLVIYKDGKVQRFVGTQFVPPSIDSATGVESQDVEITPGAVWVRLYKPKDPIHARKIGSKLPIVVYFHGGGFCIESVASPVYHNFANNLCCKGNVIVVSVEYRLAPEFPLPIAYEDSWVGLKWVFENGYEYPWIRDYGDMGRVYLGGDSAGANIAHYLGKRVGLRKENGGLKLKGIFLIHPFFWGKERIGLEMDRYGNFPGGELADRVWVIVNPGSSGLDDPVLNPAMDLDLGELGGEKVMVFVAEYDPFRDRGVQYKEVLIKSGCKASVEVVETLGEGHCFHLQDPDSMNAGLFMNQIAAFLNSS